MPSQLKKIKPFLHSWIALGYNKAIIGKIGTKGAFIMNLILILAVSAVFLAAIFTAGYDDKPGVTKK